MRILIAHNVARKALAWRDAIATRLPQSTVVTWPEALDDLADYAIGWQPPEELFQRECRLKAFFVAGAGVDQVLAMRSLDPRLPIIRLEDAGMGRQIAHYCLHQVLDWYTKRNAYESQQQNRTWKPLPAVTPAEWPIGIFGLGRLGQHVAQAFLSLGFPVHGYTRSPRPIEGVRSYVDPEGTEEALAAFLGATRVLILMAPLTIDTRDRFNATRLRHLQAGSYLINVARGELLVENDLIELLDSGHLCGASLDVFREEPLPADHPLWRHPGVRVTPHVAAVTLIPEAADQIVAKIHDFESGRPVSGVVVRRRGY
jgi:glyoxylate/hydroxypyruvate reductase A